RLMAPRREAIVEFALLVVSRTTGVAFVVWSIYAGAQVRTYSARDGQALGAVFTFCMFWQAGVWSVTAASAWVARKRRRGMAAERAVAGSLGIIGFMINVVIWSMVLLLTLDNLGVDITALIAGLGIGGIAVALAVQNILGDLFASLSITLDRPFVVGDF